jgi:hypothetical protein
LTGGRRPSDAEVGVIKASVKPAVAKSGAGPQRGLKAGARVRPVLGVGILLSASLVAYVALSYLNLTTISLGLSPPAPQVPDRRTGSIVILAPNMRECRHLTFDNTSGAIKDRGTGDCNDPSESAAARLGQVSSSFAGR